MVYNTDTLESEVPLVWNLRRENEADICVSLNTAEVNPEGSPVGYVERAKQYREEMGNGKKERFVIVSDNLNAAVKTSYLFAGDVKNGYIVEKSDDDDLEDEDDEEYSETDEQVIYFNKSETEGVYMAEINLHSFLKKIGPDTGFTIELDGAIFYGAESEQEIIDNLNTMLTCNLPFAALIIDEKLLSTKTVKSFLFDYWFNVYDCRGAGLNKEELINLIDRFSEGNGNLFSDYRNEELADRIMSLRGDAVKEEDILRMADMIHFHDLQKECGLYGKETVLETMERVKDI